MSFTQPWVSFCISRRPLTDRLKLTNRQRTRQPRDNQTSKQVFCGYPRDLPCNGGRDRTYLSYSPESISAAVGGGRLKSSITYVTWTLSVNGYNSYPNLKFWKTKSFLWVSSFSIHALFGIFQYTCIMEGSICFEFSNWKQTKSKPTNHWLWGTPCEDTRD